MDTITEPAVQDAPAASSPATDAPVIDSAKGAPEITPVSNGDPAEHTPTAAEDALAEFKADVAKAVTGKEVAADEGTEAPKAEATPKTDEPGAAKAKVEDPKALSQDETKVPETLTERPEWQSLTKIGDKLGPAAGKEVRQLLRGIYKREHELTTQYEKAKPAVEVVQEMFKAVGGSEQGFNNMRQLIRNHETNPAEALKMYEVLVADCRKRAGLEISSPELLTEQEQIEQQLKDGMIDTAAAEKRRTELLELQQARTARETAAARQHSELQRQQLEQAQQAETAKLTAIDQAESKWTAAKLKADPDFGVVQKVHGVFAKQNVQDFFNTNKRYPTPAEAVKILDDSLKEVKAEVLKGRPRSKERIAVYGGNGSSGNNRQQPMTDFEQFQADIDAAMNRTGR